MTGPLVSVVHATRGRPQKALSARADYMRRAFGGVDYLLVVDEDDAETRRVVETSGARHVVISPQGAVGAFNVGASYALGDVIVVAADDVEPPVGWDQAVIERLVDSSLPRVLCVGDGNRTDRLQTHPILTRARLAQQGGYVFDPAFVRAGTGMYADHDFTERAYHDGVVVEARDLVFQHKHPAFGKGEWDQAYRRVNSDDAYAKGKSVFDELAAKRSSESARREARERPPQDVCLCMIVKDEGAVLARCLASVRPFVTSWLIVDTGSTDDTREIAARSMAGIPGRMVDRPWRDFGANRTEAFALARESESEYMLVVDADDVLEPAEGFAMPPLTEDGYALRVVYGDVSWDRVHLFRSDRPWRYEGVRHELAVLESARTSFLSGLRYRVLGGGARSGDDLHVKFREDARALTSALARDPTDTRSAFYLAQSWRDAGEDRKALNVYRRRAAMPTDRAEETYCALFEAARICERVETYAEAVADYLAAFQARPTRAEPLYALARLHRLRGAFAAAAMFAAAAADIPRPELDTLFVDESVYAWRALDELAVATFWCGRRADSAAFSRALLDGADLPSDQRARVVENLRHAEA